VSDVRVLVTGGEYFGGLAAIRALARSGHQTWAAIVDENSYAARSRAAAGAVVVPDPATGALRFAEAVSTEAKRLGAQVVLPGTDLALTALAAHADAFPPTIALGVCSSQVVERATAKAALTDLAAAAGFAVPPTRQITRFDMDTEEGIEFTFPAVVKPVRSDVPNRNGTLVHRPVMPIKNAAELCAVVDQSEGDEWLVQPFLEGELFAVAGVAWEGTIVAAVHQVAQRIWPSRCGGSSYAMTVTPDEGRAQKVVRLVDDLAWSGIFQVQLLRSRTEDYLIDFNPRFYGTLALALAAGVNLPALWVEMLIGNQPQASFAYRSGVRYRAQLKDLRAIALLVRSGAWSRACRGLLPRPGTSHPVFAWNDPFPTLAGWSRVRRRVRPAIAGVVRGARPLVKEVDKDGKTP
jgi:predicted ATP-grasp superfamily ATP-dependent carboligase